MIRTDQVDATCGYRIFQQAMFDYRVFNQYIYICIGRQIDRQVDRQIGRQLHRQIDRQRDRQIEFPQASRKVISSIHTPPYHTIPFYILNSVFMYNRIQKYAKAHTDTNVYIYIQTYVYMISILVCVNTIQQVSTTMQPFTAMAPITKAQRDLRRPNTSLQDL